MKIITNRLIAIAIVLALVSVLMPSNAIGYTILWDTSHGVYVSGTYGGSGYQPGSGGYYEELGIHLAGNGFDDIDITSGGFLVDDPAGYDVAVVCATSSVGAGSIYSSQEVQRLVSFVENGGGLLIMADTHTVSKQNIEPVAQAFGITLGSPVSSELELYISDLQQSHPAFDGIDTIFTYSTTELEVSDEQFGIGWYDDQGVDKTVIAASQVQNGRVMIIGDASLWSWVPGYEENFYKEDSFGNSYNTQFSVNAFTYLAVPEPGTILMFGLGFSLFARKRRA